MTRTLMAAAAVSLGLFAAPVTAEAGSPSFNCRYAKLPSEVAICKSDELGNLDSSMAGQYFALVNDYAVPLRARRQIKGEQVAWLASRNGCGYVFACLRSSYLQRINRLNWWYGQFH